MSAHGYKVVKRIVKQLTTQAAAYAAGDIIHDGLVLFNNALQLAKHSGRIVGVTLTDKAVQNAAISLELFSKAVTGTFTVNNPIDVDDSQLAYFLGRVDILATDYKNYTDNSAASVVCNVPIVSAAINSDGHDVPSRDIYVAVVSRGTPTYVSTSDLYLSLYVEQD